MEQGRVFDLIQLERERQKDLHGKRDVFAGYASTELRALVFLKLAGDVSKVAMMLALGYEGITVADLRRELIQAVATGVAWIETFEE